MSRLIVKFYRGVKEADINIDGITLLAGNNFQGKSSVADALGAILTGDLLPDYIMKKDKQEIVNDSSGTGSIMLQDGDSTLIIDYPLAKLTVAGSPLKASETAVGSYSPVTDNDNKSRAKFFSELMKSTPSKSDLKTAIQSANIPDEHFNELWKLIEALTWDGAHERSKKKGIELKAVWKHITGETYGKNKGEVWKPEGWIIGLDSKTAETIKDNIDKMYEGRDKVVSVVALDSAEEKRLQGYADGIDMAVQNLKEQTAITENHQKELDDHIMNTSSVLSDSTSSCPYCEKPLIINVSGAIVKGEGVTKKQISTSQKKYDDHRADQEKIQASLTLAISEEAKCRGLLGDCQEAIKKLAEAGKSEKPGVTVEAIDINIHELETELILLESYQDAKTAHTDIIKNEVINDALSPDGVQQSKLYEGVRKFNLKLAEICKSADWEIMCLGDGLDFLYGTRRFDMLSTSEQFRLTTAVQLTCAVIDESDMLVIDKADILDRNGRNGLINVLLHTVKKPTLICMTISERDKMPDLSGLDGNSYWIEGGEIK